MRPSCACSNNICTFLVLAYPLKECQDVCVLYSLVLAFHLRDSFNVYVGYMYNLVLAFRLRDYCKEHEHHINAHAAVDDIKKTATLSQIDETIICRIFG